jgi:hypothetical protein
MPLPCNDQDLTLF